VTLTASEKLYYRIGEIAELLKVNTSVLRFWETQFDQLKPQKSKTGQRLYSNRDLELLKQIHQLLYKEKLTIAGAKTRITPSRKGDATEGNELLDLLRGVRQELQGLRNSLG
jgi:DNA-binding transcriptional MerR regulator